MHTKKIYFQNDRGQKLAAYLDMPVDGVIRNYAIYAHCFTCGKNLKIGYHISRALTRHHIAVLRFDFSGLGESEGDFSQTNFSTNIADLTSAARFLETNFEAPKLLIGHSLGGTAALAAAQDISSCRAITIIASPFEPVHIMDHFAEEKSVIEEQGEAIIKLGGETFTLNRQFVENLRATDMHTVIKYLKLPLLILHSPEDETVSIDNAARIYQAARHPKSFISLDNADHLLSREEDVRYAGNMIATWAGKYLVSEENKSGQSKKEGYVTTSTGQNGYCTEIDAAGHNIIADEPVDTGGTDQGASPYDLLSASLGACTGMTLRMYADRKGWPLEEVNIRLNHAKIHAEDCDNCLDTHTMVDMITREIEFVGNLTAEQKNRLVEIANRCPVHRTLQERVSITTLLSE